MTDGPKKTMLGKTQIKWLKRTLQESNATFKLIISPTPIVGPDDSYKNDNLVNPKGFRHEGEALIKWFGSTNLLQKNLYWITGDRHWQYHAKHPSGLEEFCSGALDDNNARKGRLSGDSKSTDPDGKIEQFYIQAEDETVTGGFLFIKIESKQNQPILMFQYYNDDGDVLYQTEKK